MALVTQEDRDYIKKLLKKCRNLSPKDVGDAHLDVRLANLIEALLSQAVNKSAVGEIYAIAAMCQMAGGARRRAWTPVAMELAAIAGEPELEEL